MESQNDDLQDHLSDEDAQEDGLVTSFWGVHFCVPRECTDPDVCLRVYVAIGIGLVI